MTIESQLKRDAIEIFMAGVSAVEPGRAVQAYLGMDGDVLIAGDHRISLTSAGRILVVGAGKAGAPMAGAVEKTLGHRIHEGLVVVKYGHLGQVERVEIVEAAHPVPDEAGVRAALRIRSLLEEATDQDLVICLLSGGGSALLPCPAPPVSLADKQAVTNLLLASGADIGEINCVRKHLSLLKGGGLARAAYPARVVTMILSDVVGDALDVIASGPTVGDPTTFADTMDIMKRYHLTETAPDAVLDYLSAGAAGRNPETPKPGDPELEGALNILVGTNTMAVRAAEQKAAALGYNTTILSTSITGETRDAAAAHVAAVREILAGVRPVMTPACLLSGGETTVTIQGTGKGGRNQEFVLAAGIGIRGLESVVVLSGGTDGTDGPTDAAGAIADGTTVSRAVNEDMDPAAYLANNDSYHFFRKLGDLLMTGPTLTNVMDLRVIIVAPEESGDRIQDSGGDP